MFSETEKLLADIDMKDKIFCEIVMEKRKDDNAYIKRFPVKPFVVTPKEMLEMIQNNNLSFKKKRSVTGLNAFSLTKKFVKEFLKKLLTNSK